MNAGDAILRLHNASNPDKAIILSRFFKTGKGEYAEGDIFLGLTVPISRKISKEYYLLDIFEIEKLLHSKFHEARLVALLILIARFEKNENEREKIYELYLRNTKYINNWDLVDLSAPHIVGGFLLNHSDRSVLRGLANSKSLWERRISILSTLRFIVEKKEYKDVFGVSEILLRDDHELIQKGVGWMLREVGKRISQDIEEDFLKKHYKKMPRTMLRYAIERFEESTRKKYLLGKI